MRDKRDDVIARFDAYTKTALRNCLYHIRMKEKKRTDNEFVLDADIIHISTEDDYYFEENYTEVLNFDVMIKNDLLYEALESLEKHQRDIIYLSACEKWSDVRIGNLLNMSRSKVQRIKIKVLQQIRTTMRRDDINEK